jgi:hypothetical protein
MEEKEKEEKLEEGQEKEEVELGEQEEELVEEEQEELLDVVMWTTVWRESLTVVLTSAVLFHLRTHTPVSAHRLPFLHPTVGAGAPLLPL